MMKDRNKKNWLERVVLIISGMLVFSTFGFLIYEMITDEQTPPNIDVSYGKIKPMENYLALPVKITNSGSETAENIRVEIIMGTGDTMETSQLEFQYLPGHSSVNGWATFSEDAGSSIRVHVRGYNIP